RDPCLGIARVSRRAARRSAGVAAGEVEDGDPDGRDRRSHSRRRRAALSSGDRDRRIAAVERRALNTGHRLRLSAPWPVPHDGGPAAPRPTTAARLRRGALAAAGGTAYVSIGSPAMRIFG